MKHICYIFSLLLLFLSSCDGNYLAPQESHLVVEGWIEDDGFPVVMLTKSVAVSEEFQDVSDLNKYLVKWAKVSIYDGEDSVILTSMFDDKYMPPYIYTTGRMRGKAGHTYRLKIEYEGKVTTAVTTIPQKPDIEDVKVEKVENSDSMYQVKVLLHDNPHERNYYQMFTMMGEDERQFLASYLGSVDDAILQEYTWIPVYRGRKINERKYWANYRHDEVVTIKIAQIDSISYRFWDDYNKHFALQDNMMFAPYTNLPSNIVGGSGYWCGMGSYEKQLKMPSR